MIVFGCMGMLDFYGLVDCDESIVMLYVVFDYGIMMFDIGDFYGMGDNEMLICDVLCGCICD